jgi:hypothetical protein
MKKIYIFRISLFLIIFIIIFSALQYIYGMSYTEKTSLSSTIERYNSFYKEEENTLDGIFLGTSVVDRAFLAPIAWNQEKLKIYPLSTDSQQIILTNYIIEEALKTQNIDLVIFDLHGLRSSAFKVTETNIRRVTDNMKFSINRINAINYAFGVADSANAVNSNVEESYGLAKENSIEKLYYYFSFFKYHSRLNINYTDFITPESDIKGISKSGSFLVEEQEYPYITDSTIDLNSFQEEVLIDIINYCKEKNLKLLLTSTPSNFEVWEQEEINSAIKLAEKYNIDTVNFNTDDMYEKLDFDFKTDLYNSTHLNTRGAKKVTEYLASYINENFEFEKKSENSNSEWDKAYDEYIDFYESGWE